MSKKIFEFKKKNFFHNIINSIIKLGTEMKFRTIITVVVIVSITVPTIIISIVSISNLISTVDSITSNIFTSNIQSCMNTMHVYIEKYYGELLYNNGIITDSNGKNIRNQNDIIDKIRDDLNVDITIFIRQNDDFIRIATTIKKDGVRVVDTMLDNSGKAYKSMMNQKEYIGNALILDKPYITAYKPLIDEDEEFVFGILFIGIEKEYIRKNTMASVTKSIILLLTIMSVLVLTILLISNRVLFNLFRQINDLQLKLKEIAKGDLTIKFDKNNSEKKNEIGKLIQSVAEMTDTLKNINQKIYTAAIILTKNLKDLFNSTSIVKDSANTQAVTVEETLGNFESLNKIIKIISNESKQANSYTEQAFDKAHKGMESMKHLEGEMQKIENSSHEITNIIAMINDIAEQTHLLSLNASIESARAGEAGKGFNIVAGEIRKLAEKSTTAASQIHQLITNNNKIIKEGVKHTVDTTENLKQISIANELITGLVKTITTEIEKLNLSSSEILTAINNISEIAQSNLNVTEDVSQNMNDILFQTIELQKFVGQFDVRTDKVKESQKQIEEILKVKLIDAEKEMKDIGESFLPTGEFVSLGGYNIQELQLGKIKVTGNSELADRISKKTGTSVTIFQSIEDGLIRVATTVRNFDNSRAIGTKIGADSKIYRTVMEKETYFGRAFVVNTWYVAVYKPIVDETGYIFGVLYMGIPEVEEDDTTENLNGKSEYPVNLVSGPDDYNNGIDNI